MTAEQVIDHHREAAREAGKRAERASMAVIRVRAADADAIGKIGLQYIADELGRPVIAERTSQYHAGCIIYPAQARVG